MLATMATAGCGVDKAVVLKTAGDISLKIDPINAAITACKDGNKALCDEATKAVDDIKKDAALLVEQSQ